MLLVLRDSDKNKPINIPYLRIHKPGNTSLQVPLVWLGVIIMLVVTKNAEFSEGGMTRSVVSHTRR